MYSLGSPWPYTSLLRLNSIGTPIASIWRLDGTPGMCGKPEEAICCRLGRLVEEYVNIAPPCCIANRCRFSTTACAAAGSQPRRGGLIRGGYPTYMFG